MTVMTSLPPGRGLTVADIEAMPDDGNRYELIDGVLLVSSSPGFRHQRVTLNLWRLLDEAAPHDLCVMAAPFDVLLDERSWVVPDVVAAPRDAFDDKRLPVPPLLAIEVLSPSTALTDLNVKHDRYRRSGIASYWVVDPHLPRLIVWELDGAGPGASYRQIADIAGEESWTATRPFPVTITPTMLTL